MKPFRTADGTKKISSPIHISRVGGLLHSQSPTGLFFLRIFSLDWFPVFQPRLRTNRCLNHSGRNLINFRSPSLSFRDFSFVSLFCHVRFPSVWQPCRDSLFLFRCLSLELGREFPALIKSYYRSRVSNFVCQDLGTAAKFGTDVCERHAYGGRFGLEGLSLLIFDGNPFADSPKGFVGPSDGLRKALLSADRYA